MTSATMHGPVAVRAVYPDWLDTFDDASIVVAEPRDVGDDRVLPIQRVKERREARRPRSRRVTPSSASSATDRFYGGILSVEDALEAVGLRE